MRMAQWTLSGGVAEDADTQQSFGDYGADHDLDHDPRRETPHEDQFGDAREFRSADGGEQSELVAGAHDDQVTLAGEPADGRPLFGGDG